MEIVKYLLMVIYAVVCVALTTLTFKQTKEDGASAAVMGGASSNNFYEKNKGRTRDGMLKKATVVLLVLFAILTVALGIVYVA